MAVVRKRFGQVKGAQCTSARWLGCVVMGRGDSSARARRRAALAVEVNRVAVPGTSTG